MFKKEIYSLLLFSFGLLFTCCGESTTDDEEKDNNGQGSVSVETNYLPIADQLPERDLLAFLLTI